MRNCILLILIIISLNSYAQNETEIFDRIINGEITDTSNTEFYVLGNSPYHDCFQEIEQAKKDLQKSQLPIYTYCNHYNWPDNFYETFLEIGKKHKVFMKAITCLDCDWGRKGPDGYCYSTYLRNNLQELRGIGIIDTIYNEAIYSQLMIDSNFLIENSRYISNLSAPSLVPPKVYIKNQWREQGYNGKDTLFLDKDILINRHYDVKENGEKFEYPIALLIEYRISKFGQLASIEFGGEHALNFLGYKKVSKRIIEKARAYILLKYKKWRAATLFGKPILYRGQISLIIRN